jgi:hypothetical protein
MTIDVSEVPSALDNFTDGLRRMERIRRDGSLFEVVHQCGDFTALDRYVAIPCQSAPFRMSSPHGVRTRVATLRA